MTRNAERETRCRIAEVLFGERRWHLAHGDCLDVVGGIPATSVDALVTDPPAGIGMMEREWDSDKGGRDEWIHWLSVRMREALCVLKPGAHGLVWALPRTSHWTAMSLDLAGFEIRDRVSHWFGQGYPKSLNMVNGSIDAGEPYPNISAAPYELAEWMREHRSGYGTALKPACEDWWLVRKPPIGTVLDNVRERGTGAINLDGCRVSITLGDREIVDRRSGAGGISMFGGDRGTGKRFTSDPHGRWPAHLVLSHGPDCRKVGTRKVKAAPSWNDNRSPSLFSGAATSPVHHADDDGTETIDDWRCADGCPVKLLDAQSGVLVSSDHTRQNNAHHSVAKEQRDYAHESRGHSDEGGASRYFTQFEHDADALRYEPFLYTRKASTDERERGCEHLPAKNLTGRKVGSAGTENPRADAGRKGERRNVHPTVKSGPLMRWLCRLVTPPGGIVVDLFTGSGSTAVAALAEGFRFIGAELDGSSCEIARARIVGDAPLFNREASKGKLDPR
jgi:DNA modification methylase